MFRVNFHFALFTFAFGFIDFFGPIYFLKIGISLSGICLFWALFFLLRFFLRPLLVAFCHRYGLRTAFLLSIFLSAGRFVLYTQLESSQAFLLPLVFWDAFTSALYWLVYHSYFAILGTTERRGQEVAWRDASLLVAKLLSPLCSAFLIEGFGFVFAFWIAALITVLSVAPVMRLELPQREFPEFNLRALLRTDKAGFFIYGTSAFHEYAHGFLWKIVLFLHLGNYLGYGGLVAVGVFFQVVGTFVAGRQFDIGRTLGIATLGVVLLIAVLFARVFLPLSVPVIVSLDFSFMIAGVFVFPILSALSYNHSKLSGNPLWFQCLAESGWDLGAMTVLTLSAVLLWYGVDLRHLMLIGAGGLVGSLIVLRIFENYPNRSTPK